MKLDNSAQRPYACGKCSRSFTTPSNLKRHDLEKHQFHSTHGSGYPCRFQGCHRSIIPFSRQENLLNHTKHVHGHGGFSVLSSGPSEITPESIDHRKGFSAIRCEEDPSPLLPASGGVGGGADIGDTESRSPSKIAGRGQTHCCSLCGKKFRYASKLRDHALIHSGKKIYNCRTCPKSYMRKRELVRHIKNAHPDIRPIVDELYNDSPESSTRLEADQRPERQQPNIAQGVSVRDQVPGTAENKIGRVPSLQLGAGGGGLFWDGEYGAARTLQELAAGKGKSEMAKIPEIPEQEQNNTVRESGHDSQRCISSRLLEGILRELQGNAPACHDYNSLLRGLLEKGGDVNQPFPEYHGSALQAMACEGSEEIVKILLEKGANVNAEGGFHGTALQAAAYHGHENVVRLLLEKGSNVNARGGYYGSALQAALCKNHQRVAKILLERGADVNAWESKGGKASLTELLHDNQTDSKLPTQQIDMGVRSTDKTQHRPCGNTSISENGFANHRNVMVDTQC